MPYSLSLYLVQGGIFSAVSYGSCVEGESIEFGVHETHSSHLLYFVDSFLKKHELSPKHLKVLCCPRGPQGFTTLRIGLSFAIGMKIACNGALYFCPTHFEFFQYLGRKIYAKNPFLIKLHIKRDLFYGCLVSLEGDCDTLLPQIMREDERDPLIPVIQESDFIGQNLAQLLLEMYREKGGTSSKVPKPYYLHTPPYVIGVGSY